MRGLPTAQYRIAMTEADACGVIPTSPDSDKTNLVRVHLSDELGLDDLKCSSDRTTIDVGHERVRAPLLFLFLLLFFVLVRARVSATPFNTVLARGALDWVTSWKALRARGP